MMRSTTMRTVVTALSLAAAASVLAACAGSTQMATRAEEYAQLQTQCQAQGGQFYSTGRMTGMPALDNACRNYNPLPGTQNGPASSRDPG